MVNEKINDLEFVLTLILKYAAAEEANIYEYSSDIKMQLEELKKEKIELMKEAKRRFYTEEKK